MGRKAVEEDEYEYEDEIVASAVSEMHLITQNPRFFDFVLQIMNMESDVDVEALSAEFPDTLYKRRKGDFGKELVYVPAKEIRARLNEVLGCKWSFIILAEQRVSDPLPYTTKEGGVKTSSNYLKVIGMLAIPGLGVQVQYGVKKTFGSNESNDWKAAATDCFKKCCAGFGLEATYDDEDEEEGTAGSGGRSAAKKGSLDELLEDVEYDEEEFEEALEHEITWGKFKNLTLEEIYDEDPDYLEWVAENARDEADQEATLIVLKGKLEAEASKKTKKGKGTKKSSTTSKSSEKTSRGSKSSKTGTKGKTSAKSGSPSAGANKKKRKETDEDDEINELIETIEEILEDDDSYDEVTIKSLIQSVSTSRKNPNGKSELEELTLKELKALAEVLLDEEEEDEDDDE